MADQDGLGDRPVTGNSGSEFIRNPAIAGTSARSNQTQSSTAESPLVQDVFSMFKNYLEVKLEEKGKQIEGKSETDKQVAQLRFEGNQKQFEHNAKLDSVLDRIKAQTIDGNDAVSDLIKEGKELIRTRQKLIRIADKSVDGWKVVDEYVSDDLASGSEDDKRLRRARQTVGRKRKQSAQHRSDYSKRFRSTLSSSDQQLFRGKVLIYSLTGGFLCERSLCLGSLAILPYLVAQFLLWIYKMKMIYVRLNVVN